LKYANNPERIDTAVYHPPVNFSPGLFPLCGLPSAPALKQVEFQVLQAAALFGGRGDIRRIPGLKTLLFVLT
jgi:hypothetical protein